MESKGSKVGLTAVYIDSDSEFASIMRSWFAEESPHDITIITATDATTGRHLAEDTKADCIVISDEINKDVLTLLDDIAEDFSDTPVFVFANSGTPEIVRKVQKRGAEYLHRGTGSDQFEILANRMLKSSGVVDPTRTSDSGCHFRTLPLPAIAYRNGVIIDANTAFHDWVGPMPECSLAGQPISKFLQSDSVEQVKKATRRLKNGESATESLNISVMRNDNTMRETTATIFRAPSTDGQRDEIVFVDESKHREFRRDVEAVTRASRSLLTVDTPKNAAELLVDIAENLLDMRLIVVWLYDVQEEQLNPVAVGSQVDEVPGIREKPDPIDEGTYEMQAFRRGEMVCVDDYQSVANRSQKRVGIGTQVMCPMGRHGMLTVCSLSVVGVDDDEMRLIKLLARHGEAAIDRVGHMDDIQEFESKLQSYEERINAIGRITSRRLRVTLEKIRTKVSGGDHHIGVQSHLEQMGAAAQEIVRMTRYGWSTGILEPVELEAVVDEAWRAVDSQAATLTVEGNLGTVIADRDRLVEMVEHLLDNAVKHTQEEVYITVGRLNGGFYIEDSGNGLPNGGEIFEVEQTVSEGRVGIGLAIVDNIVNGHGWEIESTTGESGGARFEVTGVEFHRAGNDFE